ncbi:MAG: 2-oxoacid:acceptor oxidoreductase family protein [Methanocorpusculum sp.]|jgi:2-oxoglutarate ferredoxin oxidoreductase subunit gamma|uniref:2-oxoglutarate ferredoxin oxidoreductase subunit gamma n=1 Tax=Methanocorpusculum parvum TaxID=2193 RepID=A0AAX0Q6U7_9EURY|nr:2-oxoacid:acceptor oxidoreductase family protein [Methanocorpusculum parvum]MDD2248731.1 2-oxoacid:acceptor oxidoreductase family protein [Methanocorpusculum sp.]MDD2803357.1 2-oxoacid:acceptor oxidoreductase family protein [Methanocorpusculum sp.]MDD3912800.1 2-oxoacid:acceptor oxidoreductase family protein [Methanocorpusculum sp.]MDY3202564.1 2-oxoacid:acceptor oxidoreductase family protein [Methanocorpusculum sp.]PAV08823.1 2-oxoglutarate ferredoxin oxidoreductase subunit gamma [Methanoc
MKSEIRFSGLGGQGIITAAVILGRAAALYGNKYVVQTQSYGPEARGGASASAVIISDDPIHYPKVTDPDVYAIMSQEAYNKYGSHVKNDAVMLLDPGYVTSRPACRYYEVPATAEAKSQLGKTVFANVIMLGGILEATGIVSYDALEHAVLDSVPKGTEENNKRALAIGQELVRSQQ